MNEDPMDVLSDGLQCGRRVEAPPHLWSRIAGTAAAQSPTTSQRLGALTLGCASFVFAAKLWQLADPHPLPPAITAESAQVRDVEASLALALPWFETGRLDTTLAFAIEDRPELLLLREAHALHLNPPTPEPPR